ncbi:MAG: carboxymuconolactone decarboxylase family protein [Candidatus Methanofastidiosia archaeon]
MRQEYKEVLDRKTKELIALGTSLGVNCHPCIKHHLELARELGLSEEEIMEALNVGKKVKVGAARSTENFLKNFEETEAFEESGREDKKSCC